MGLGKVRPQVSVAMNFQQVEETVEQYDPQGSVIQQHSRQTGERANPATAASGGIVGPPVPQPPPPASRDAGDTAAR